MKYLSNVYTGASGSLGGTTYSRNRGGNYTRAKAMPTNPNTPLQQQMREIMGSLSANWNNILTQEQRDGWNLYANNVPVVDTLGQTIHLSGFNHYCRSNSPRLQAILALVQDAPTTFNLGGTPIISSWAPSAPDVTTVIAGITPPTVVTDRLLVYVGRPVSPGREFFRGPYRFMGTIAATVLGVFNSAVLVSPWVMTNGQRVFMRCRVTLTDGRLSASAQASNIASP